LKVPNRVHYTGFYYTPENNERKQEEKRRRGGNKTTMNTLIKFSTLSEKYSEVEEHGKIRTGLWHIHKNPQPAWLHLPVKKIYLGLHLH
jgi:hypothetical protein